LRDLFFSPTFWLSATTPPPFLRFFFYQGAVPFFLSKAGLRQSAPWDWSFFFVTMQAYLPSPSPFFRVLPNVVCFPPPTGEKGRSFFFFFFFFFRPPGDGCPFRLSRPGILPRWTSPSPSVQGFPCSPFLLWFFWPPDPLRSALLFLRSTLTRPGPPFFCGNGGRGPPPHSRAKVFQFPLRAFFSLSFRILGGTPGCFFYMLPVYTTFTYWRTTFLPWLGLPKSHLGDPPLHHTFPPWHLCRQEGVSLCDTATILSPMAVTPPHLIGTFLLIDTVSPLFVWPENRAASFFFFSNRRAKPTFPFFPFFSCPQYNGQLSLKGRGRLPSSVLFFSVRAASGPCPPLRKKTPSFDFPRTKFFNTAPLHLRATSPPLLPGFPLKKEPFHVGRLHLPFSPANLHPPGTACKPSFFLGGLAVR